jgi:hypothetical protein
MIFEEKESLPLDERFRLWSGRLQLWRLCCSTACRRARFCRGDPRRCGGRFANWAGAVKEAARREINARDPQRQALIADLEQKIIRLGKAMTDGA